MRRFFLLVLLFSCAIAFTQKVQYSKQTLLAPSSDAIQLVADISGYHHMLSFTAKEKPVIYVFSPSLQLEAKTEVPLKVPERADIKVLPFPDFYFLYVHRDGSATHELWKIDRMGNAVSLTAAMEAVIQEQFKKHTATFQLIHKDKQFAIVGQTYYSELEKIKANVIMLDSSLNTVFSHKILFDFKRKEEDLKQVALEGNHLLVLKSGKDGMTGSNFLQLQKINITTGHTIVNRFTSGSNIYLNPAFIYNPSDSSIFIHAIIWGSGGTTKPNGVAFFNKLDHLLHEQASSVLLKNQFRSSLSNFLLLDGPAPQWISVQIVRPDLFRKGSYTPSYDRAGDFYINSNVTYNSNFELSMPSASRSTFTEPRTLSVAEGAIEGYHASNVRLSFLNDKFKIVKDSLMKKGKEHYDIQTYEFAKFTMNNYGYLILRHSLSPKQQGLLMIRGSHKKKLAVSDLRMFENYQYMLPLLRAVRNDYVLLPYTFKKEIGLVKIILE